MKQQVNSNPDLTKHEIPVISTETIDEKNAKKSQILINFDIITINKLLNKRK